ncbi:hypothetical protein [Telluribacter humicola]|uniref:hypothetical protein n=1 Tax=Telluribacter humicola TaxID=1720261 RepID=UPI001A9770C6|nr:hypothetical protein [Telluribacter humicola]
MKKILLLTAICSCYTSLLWAQSPNIIRVKNVEDLKKSVSAKDQYRYPNFTPGTISFFNGPPVDTKINFNVLLNEMQFLNPRGDTLALANEFTIKNIKIADDQYLYNPKVGFVEVVNDTEGVKLAIHPMLIQVQSEKMGGYNQSSGASAISRYKTFSDQNGRVQHLDVKGDILLARHENYYLVDKNNAIYLANKGSLLKLYSDHKRILNEYLKEHKTNFNNKEELKALLKYSNELPAK